MSLTINERMNVEPGAPGETGASVEQLAWSPEWPGAPGWYWFFGKRSRGGRIELRPARMQIAGGKQPFRMYVCDGAFMYPDRPGRPCGEDSGAEGLWLPMTMPELTEAMRRWMEESRAADEAGRATEEAGKAAEEARRIALGLSDGPGKE